MKKSEVCTGMRFLFRNGGMGIVMLKTRNGDMVIGKKCIGLYAYNDDLTTADRSLDEMDVMAVYLPNHTLEYMPRDLTNLEAGCSAIWSRGGAVEPSVVGKKGKEPVFHPRFHNSGIDLKSMPGGKG